MKNSMRRAGLIVGVFVFLLAGESYGDSNIPALRDVKEPQERVRVQALIEGARSEGKLIIDGIMVEPKHAKFIWEGFKAYYGLPGAELKYTYSSANQIVTAVNQLILARRPTPDIVWNTTWAWYKDLLAQKQLLRYDSPMYKEYTISNEIGNSMPGYWVSDSYTFSPMWNPAALEKRGIKNFNPTSWWEFVDPKFTKMVSVGNILRGGSATLWGLGLRKVLKDDWFIKMAQLKPAFYIKTAQGRDWCASGEYPITLFSHAKNAESVKETGVPVKLLYPKEGVVFLPFAPVILASGSHPHTAKLFIDYIRSVPGTNRMAAADVSLFFGRPGVKLPPNEFLPPAEKIKIIPMNWDKEATPEALKEISDWSLKIGASF